jgi:hypothetical protein
MARSLISSSFPIVDTVTGLRPTLGTTKFVEARLRTELPTPIYWVKYPGGRKIYWNLRLVQDYLINGASPNHDRLVEEYLATLPSGARR